MDIPQNDAWHAEQRRKSQDLIRVYNPTEEDYILIWDTERFIIPSKDHNKGWGNGMRVMQRYLAQKYTKEMVDKILTERQDKQLAERIIKLNTQGNEYPTYNANMQMQGLRTDSPSLREPLEDSIWLGIEEEFGVDRDFVEIKEEKPMMQVDTFDRLKDKKYVSEEIKPVPPIVETKEEVEKPPVYISKKERIKQGLPLEE